MTEFAIITRTEAEYRTQRAAEEVLFRFHALIDIPGDLKPIDVIATDYSEACRKAAEHAATPFKGYQRSARVHRVDPKWDMAIVDGRPMTRASFERRPRA